MAYKNIWTASTPAYPLVVAIAPDAGDYLVGFSVADAGGGTPTVPSGWTQIGTTLSSTFDGASCALIAKIADGTETSVSFGFNSLNTIGGVISFDNVDQATPLDVAVVTFATSSGVTVADLTISPATAGTMLLHVRAVDGPSGDASFTFATQAGTTEAWTQRADLTSGFYNIAVAETTVPSTNEVTARCTTSQTGGALAFLIAIRPATPAGPVGTGTPNVEPATASGTGNFIYAGSGSPSVEPATANGIGAAGPVAGFIQPDFIQSGWAQADAAEPGPQPVIASYIGITDDNDSIPKIASGPSGGLSFTMHGRIPDPGAVPWTQNNTELIRVIGSNWRVEFVNGSKVSSTTERYMQINSMPYATGAGPETYIGDYSWIWTTADNGHIVGTIEGVPYDIAYALTDAMLKGWIGYACQVVPSASGITVRMWIKYPGVPIIGPATSFVPIATMRSAMIANGWTSGQANAWTPSSTITGIELGGVWTGTVQAQAINPKVYAETTEPSEATLLSRLGSMAPDATAWADWSLAWEDGACNLSDRSGNIRPLTMPTAATQGTASPFFYEEEPETITGTGSATGTAVTTSGAGALIVQGTGGGSSVATTAAGVGSIRLQGTGSTSCTSTTASGAGGQILQGNGSPSAAATASSGTGNLTVAGTGSPSGTASTSTGNGRQVDIGTGAPSSTPATASGSGSLKVTGTGAPSVVASSSTGTGTLTLAGTGTVPGTAATASGSGSVGSSTITGTGTPNATAATATGTGAQLLQGTGTPAGTPAASTGTGSLTVQTILKNFIPVMTSNTAPSGVASASSQFAAYAPWRAMDGVNDALGWATSHVANPFPQWIQYASTEKRFPLWYAVTSRNEAGAARNMKTWQFRASDDDGVTWDVLDTRTNVTDWGNLANVRKQFSITATKAYSSFQLLITASNDGTYVGLGVLEVAVAVDATAGVASGSGQLVLQGAGAPQTPATTATGAAAITLAGTGNAQGTPVIASGAGSEVLRGTGAAATIPATAAGTGTSSGAPISGVGAAAGIPTTAAGQGSLRLAGDGTTSSGPATASGQGRSILAGTGASSGAASTGAGTGQHVNPSSGVSSGAAATAAGIGRLVVEGLATAQGEPSAATGQGVALLVGLGAVSSPPATAIGEGSTFNPTLGVPGKVYVGGVARLITVADVVVGGTRRPIAAGWVYVDGQKRQIV